MLGASVFGVRLRREGRESRVFVNIANFGRIWDYAVRKINMMGLKSPVRAKDVLKIGTGLLRMLEVRFGPLRMRMVRLDPMRMPLRYRKMYCA